MTSRLRLPVPLALVVVVLAAVALIASTAHVPADAATRTITLGGVKVRVTDKTQQVVTINRSSGTRARATYWRKTAKGWDARRTTKNARIGSGGLVAGHQRKQWTSTTPIGTYKMREAFGNSAAPAGTDLPFHRVRSGDYWVQDNASRYYNQLRNKSQGGFRWSLPSSKRNSSEYLPSYGTQYRWAIVIDFNRPVAKRKKGSGIFLHVNGRGATGGCVSVPKAFMRDMMELLDPKYAPRIAIGR
ncbi:L,D-transpeptidase family protein [Solicola sp. PLA-1-18]|uniref:L,D-transpeptidase family protein n=1 Tax=Solicola sp. PLA-1-18 TaxID=3380532 RepID=UPI003B7DECCC